MRTRTTLNVLLICLCACDSSSRVARDQAMFPKISQSRPPGTVCKVGDSASVTRRASHPLGPTGGWSGKLRVDATRRKSLEENSLAWFHGTVSGYVRFGTSGHLRMRSYDDTYGAVYCGWHPDGLEIPATTEHLFVSLPQCAVGDGGLDQVHEVCWFPAGASEGVLLYSTAHRTATQPALGATDLFRMEQLGSEFYVNHSLASALMRESLQDGRLDDALEILTHTTSLFQRMRPAVDASTGRQISPQELHQEEWAGLVGFKLGFSLGTPEFDAALGEAQKVSGRDRGLKGMIPLLQWVHLKLRGETAVVPSATPGGSVGREPGRISRFLQGEIEERKFLMGGSLGAQNHRFWIALKHLTEGDREVGIGLLKEFLDDPAMSADAELVIASRLYYGVRNPTAKGLFLRIP